jgi:hypothetical protein
LQIDIVYYNMALPRKLDLPNPVADIEERKSNLQQVCGRTPGMAATLTMGLAALDEELGSGDSTIPHEALAQAHEQYASLYAEYRRLLELSKKRPRRSSSAKGGAGSNKGGAGAAKRSAPNPPEFAEAGENQLSQLNTKLGAGGVALNMRPAYIGNVKGMVSCDNVFRLLRHYRDNVLILHFHNVLTLPFHNVRRLPFHNVRTLPGQCFDIAMTLQVSCILSDMGLVCDNVRVLVLVDIDNNGKHLLEYRVIIKTNTGSLNNQLCAIPALCGTQNASLSTPLRFKLWSVEHGVNGHIFNEQQGIRFLSVMDHLLNSEDNHFCYMDLIVIHSAEVAKMFTPTGAAYRCDIVIILCPYIVSLQCCTIAVTLL